MWRSVEHRGWARRGAVAVLVVLAAWGALGCDDDGAPAERVARTERGAAVEPAEAEPGEPSSSREPGPVDPASVGFDLGAIMDQVHFAYRRDEETGRFAGGHTTYAVEVDPSGATLRAHHAPDAGGEEPGEARREEPWSPDEVIESDPLHLETARIARGSRELAARGRGTAEVARDGHLEIARAEVVEHWRNGAEGVEQSWAFGERPAGQGDLIVRVESRGMQYVEATEHGLHLADASTGLGFRYGHGTWVDASGRETAVPARWVRGGIELTVPRVVVDGASYPAVLDPVISPEVGVNERVIGPTMERQMAPSVASDGSSFLIVWEDWRNPVTLRNIYGARVSAAGQLLDGGGIAISSGGSSETRPSVAWGGSAYLVVWEDWRNSAASGGDIYGARVSAAGDVLDAHGIAISTAPRNQAMASVSWSGSAYLVVWADERSSSTTGSDIYGARVTVEGEVLSELAISTATAAQVAPRVEWGGSAYLVVWEDGRSSSTTGTDIYGARVSVDGEVLSELAISTAPNAQVAPSVSWSGSSYLVVWQDSRSSTTSRAAIYGARVSAEGSLLDESGLAVSSGLYDGRAPALVWSGSSYLVVWQEWRNYTASGSFNWDIYGTRLSAEGDVLAGSEVAISTAVNFQEAPRVAWNGSSHLVAWQDLRNNTGSDWDIYGARVSADGSVLDESGVLVSIAANEQRTPSVAWSGSAYLLVWEDRRSWRSAGWDIYGARVSAEGSMLDESGIPISTAVGHQQRPNVAWSGSSYLVVWDDGRGSSGTNGDIYGARVSAEGGVLDEGGIAISTAEGQQSRPKLSWSGSSYLVVWGDGRASSATGSDIYGARVSAAGEVLDASGIAISTAPGAQGRPSVAGSGSAYLVVWEDLRTPGTTDADVYGARVSAAGEVLDEIAISTAAGSQGWVAAAWGGDEYLVVWTDWRSSSTTDTDIYGARVSADGVVLDESGIAISTAPHTQGSPSVSWGRSAHLVVWEQSRYGFHRDIYGTRIRAGVVESPGGLPLAADPTTNEQAPHVTGSADEDTWLLAYQRLLPEAPYAAIRARARLVRYGADVGARCGSDTDCESGFCTDGVCCDTRCGNGTLDCQACSVAAGAAVDGTCAPTTGNACVDGLGCTLGDACSAGTCIGGTASPCDAAIGCAELGGGAFTCGPCPAGTYTAAGGGSTVCVSCAAGTWSSDGATACAAWTECPAGSYVAVLGTATRDGVCDPCVAESYSTTANASSCMGWSTCDAGTYVAASGTSMSDRECTECPSGSYSTGTNAPTCVAWSGCASTAYEAAVPTATSDRVCTPLTVCGPGEYEVTPPTATSDRGCAPVGPCGEGEYELSPPTAISDRACAPYTECQEGQYQSVAPTGTSDRACTACTVCGAGEAEVSACAAAVDAVCEPVGDVDGGMVDGGVVDGGVVDGGVVDGGASDAAVGFDGGPETPNEGGCGCAVPGRSGGIGRGALALLALLGLVIVRRRGP